MSKSIFLNLPVKDLKASIDFYTQIGFSNNPQFSDATGACMVLSDTIYVMLLTHDKFHQFTSKSIADTKHTISVINTLSVESNDIQNKIIENALKAGGTEPHPLVDYGFMQSRAFEDLDGHLWGIIYMDMSKLPQQ